MGYLVVWYKLTDAGLKRFRNSSWDEVISYKTRLVFVVWRDMRVFVCRATSIIDVMIVLFPYLHCSNNDLLTILGQWWESFSDMGCRQEVLGKGSKIIVKQSEEGSAWRENVLLFNIIITNLNNIIGRFAIGYCDSVIVCKSA